MKGRDWLPTKRSEILAMAKCWVAALTNSRMLAWGVKEEEKEELSERLASVEAEFNTPDGSKNPIYYSRLNDDFRNLIGIMRKMKRLRFVSPTLRESDFIALGLRAADTTRSVIGEPKVPVEGDVSYPSTGIVQLKIIRGGVNEADKRPTYGVRIYYGIIGEPTDKDKFRISQPPKTGEDLPHSVFTRRKSKRFDFSSDSGKEVFFCMRYENSKGQTGPWGKVIRTFIP